MENLFFTILGAFIGWIPGIGIWFRDRYTSIGAPGVAFVVRPHNRSEEAHFKCKIHVDITNGTGGPIRMISAYFVFDLGTTIKADPKWSCEHGTNRHRVLFFSPAKKSHESPDCYLRADERTDIWIGIDPKCADEHIGEAGVKKMIGHLYFQMTRWSESGSPTARWIKIKL